MLVLAPHKGIVPSKTWLSCHSKLMNNIKIQSARKATHAWPAGKIIVLQVELLHVDSEIEKLVDSLTGANNVLLSYVNVKIEKLSL